MRRGPGGDSKSIEPLVPPERALKSILVICFSDLAMDPRVNRQIRALVPKYRVYTAGTGDSGIPGVTHFPIPAALPAPKPFLLRALNALSLKLGNYERYYWTGWRVQHCLSMLAGFKADIVLANDLNTLPLALRLAQGAIVVYDAHEYAPREYDDSLLWRFLFRRYVEYLCRRYLCAAHGMLTVCQSIADEYRANYGVDPRVLMNAPAYHDLTPRATQAQRIRMVHHGLVHPSRGLDVMIRMTDHLDERFHLDLYLIPSATRYFGKLAALAAARPRVRILPPVPMRELPHRLNEYDIGLYLLPPATLNYQFMLPNKFFEFIQARLAVAIGPSPEMARLVKQYDCGIVADDFNPLSLAKRLNALDAGRIDACKQRSHLAAQELCFERNAEVLLGMIDRLLGAA
jgi:hypothetical protein